jgi:hypothetical protein
MKATVPNELPQRLHPGRRRVLSHWESLRRGENEMPFWDDVKLAALPDLAGRLRLIDVFDDPERFRFSLIGVEFSHWFTEPVAGKFADEISHELHSTICAPNAVRR